MQTKNDDFVCDGPVRSVRSGPVGRRDPDMRVIGDLRTEWERAWGDAMETAEGAAGDVVETAGGAAEEGRNSGWRSG